MKFIALDLSSSVCGYTICEDDKILEINYLELSEENMIDKGLQLKNFLLEIKNKNEGLDTMVIESHMKSFSSGKSSGDAMFKTAQINYLGRYLCKIEHDLNIVELNVIAARNKWKPGFTKIARAAKGIKDKEVAFKLALPELELLNIKLPTKILKSGPNKGNVVYLGSAEDMVDSYILSQAFIKNGFKEIISNEKAKKEKKPKPKKK